MKTVILIRAPSTDSGTFGQLTVEGSDFSCVTLEPINPIPEGAYRVIWTQTPIHGWIYELVSVVGHTGILIHVGNIARDTHDCILVGSEQAIFPPGSFGGVDVPTKGIQNSHQTLMAFESILNRQPFTLIIQ